MRACHSCKHSLAIAEGRWRTVPWSRTPCAKCEEFSYDLAVEFNEELCEGVGEGAAGTAAEPSERLLPVWVLVRFLKGLMSLSPRIRDAVSLRAAGLTFVQIARHLRITPEAAQRRVRRALVQDPELSGLLRQDAARKGGVSRGGQEMESDAG